MPPEDDSAATLLDTPPAGSEAPTAAPTAAPELTPEAKAAADAAAKAALVPEQYEDFTAPEGVSLDPEIAADMKALAKELGLPQAKAQQVADLGVKMSQKWEAKQAEQLATTTANWADATRADKEIGGDNLAENLGVAKAAITTFASPELRELLNKSGLGNHPEVVRMFYKVGKATAGDTIQTGKAPPAAETAKTMYPNSNMN